MLRRLSLNRRSAAMDAPWSSSACVCACKIASTQAAWHHHITHHAPHHASRCRLVIVIAATQVVFVPGQAPAPPHPPGTCCPRFAPSPLTPVQRAPTHPTHVRIPTCSAGPAKLLVGGSPQQESLSPPTPPPPPPPRCPAAMEGILPPSPPQSNPSGSPPHSATRPRPFPHPNTSPTHPPLPDTHTLPVDTSRARHAPREPAPPPC